MKIDPADKVALITGAGSDMDPAAAGMKLPNR